jgi:uncharacterized lipoprotein NlpE involved in copper resistance
MNVAARRHFLFIPAAPCFLLIRKRFMPSARMLCSGAVLLLLLGILVGCDKTQQLLDEAQKKAEELAAQPTPDSAPDSGAAATPPAVAPPSITAPAATPTPGPSSVPAPEPPSGKNDDALLAQWEATPSSQRNDAAIAQLIAASPERLATLVKVDLTGSGVTEQGLEQLVTHVPNLAYVNLSSVTMSQAKIDRLGQLAKLRALHVNGSLLQNGMLASLGQVQTLEEFHANSNQFTDEGLKPLKALPNLAVVHLSQNNLDGSFLAKAKYLGSLRELNVSFTQFGRLGFVALKGAELEVFDAAKAMVDDGSLVGLAGHRQLRVLRLNANSISDVGLLKLRGMSKLEEVNLSYTQVTGRGLAFLRPAKKLKAVWLDHTAVDGSAVAELKKTFPAANIYQ